MFQEQLAALPNIDFDGNTVLFHLGDWNPTSSSSCLESSYQEMDALYDPSLLGSWQRLNYRLFRSATSSTLLVQAFGHQHWWKWERTAFTIATLRALVFEQVFSVVAMYMVFRKQGASYSMRMEIAICNKNATREVLVMSI